MSPAFAAKWLLPRIDRFQNAWPETDVRLDTSLKLMDFAAQGIDIGVRYGSGHWPGLMAEKLMDEEVFPVCSPGFLHDHPRLRKPADLNGLDDLSVDRQTGFLRRRLLSEPNDIEDLVQEVLLAVHNARASWRSGESLTAWTHAIARYKLTDYFSIMREARVTQ